MAIAVTVLDSGIDTTDATSYTTASVSPAPDSLLLVFAASSDASLAPTIDASGLGLTWTTEKDQPFGSSSSDVRRLAAFSAQCGASPGSGAITFTMSALSTHVAWVVIEITGHDTAAPLPQVVGGRDDSTSATTLTLAMAAPASADSRPIAWWGSRQSLAGTAEAGWTELFQDSTGSPTMRHEAEWKSDGFDTTPSITFPAQRIGGIAVEVAAATGAVTPATGSGSGSVAWTGTASGSAPQVPANTGSASGSATWTGTAAGTSPAVPVASGAASGTVSWTGSASGFTPTVGGASGSAAGTVAWTGQGAGTAPPVPVATGTASGAVTWSGTATGGHLGERRDLKIVSTTPPVSKTLTPGPNRETWPTSLPASAWTDTEAAAGWPTTEPTL